MSLPSLRDYCVAVAQSVTSTILEKELPLGDPIVEKMITDLEQEFIDGYADIGMPFGELESDLVRYLIQNLTISMEEEE